MSLYIPYKCDGCGKHTITALVVCTGCRGRVYCDDGCQKRGWLSHHSQYCDTIKQLVELCNEFISADINGNEECFDVSGRFIITEETRKLEGKRNKAVAGKNVVRVIDTLKGKDMWLFKERVEKILKKAKGNEQELDRMLYETFSVVFSKKGVPYELASVFDADSPILKTILMYLSSSYDDLSNFCLTNIMNELKKYREMEHIVLLPRDIKPSIGSVERCTNNYIAPGLFSRHLCMETSNMRLIDGYNFDISLYQNRGMKITTLMVDDYEEGGKERYKYNSDLVQVLKHNEMAPKSSTARVGERNELSVMIMPKRHILPPNFNIFINKISEYINETKPVIRFATSIDWWNTKDMTYFHTPLIRIDTLDFLYHKDFENIMNKIDTKKIEAEFFEYLIEVCRGKQVKTFAAGPILYSSCVGKLQQFSERLYLKNNDLETVKFWFINDGMNEANIGDFHEHDQAIKSPKTCCITLDITDEGNKTAASNQSIIFSAIALAKQFLATEMKIRFKKQDEDSMGYEGETIPEEYVGVLNDLIPSRLEKLEIWCDNFKTVVGLVAAVAAPGVLKELRIFGVNEIDKITEHNGDFQFDLRPEHYVRYEAICSKLQHYHEIDCSVPCIKNNVLGQSLRSLSLISTEYTPTQVQGLSISGSFYTLERFKPEQMVNLERISISIPYFDNRYYKRFSLNINTIEKVIDLTPNATAIHVDCSMEKILKIDHSDFVKYFKTDIKRDPIYPLLCACEKGRRVSEYIISFDLADRADDNPRFMNKMLHNYTYDVLKKMKPGDNDELIDPKDYGFLYYPRRLERPVVVTAAKDFRLVIRGLGVSSTMMLYDCVSRVPKCTSLVFSTKLNTWSDKTKAFNDRFESSDFTDYQDYVNEAKNEAKLLGGIRSINENLQSIEFCLRPKSADLVILPLFPNLKRITMVMLTHEYKSMNSERKLAIKLIRESERKEMHIEIRTPDDIKNNTVRTIASQISVACPNKTLLYTWITVPSESDWNVSFPDISDY
jgi:hypothetical protein